MEKWREERRLKVAEQIIALLNIKEIFIVLLVKNNVVSF
jgi:hypothetical protein